MPELIKVYYVAIVSPYLFSIGVITLLPIVQEKNIKNSFQWGHLSLQCIIPFYYILLLLLIINVHFIIHIFD
jgi:hypothetical protein